MSNDLTIQRAYVELSVIEGELSILVDRIRKVMYQLRHGHDGSVPSPAKPRTRRQFNDDMLQLLEDRGHLPPDRERQDREATRPLREKLKHAANADEVLDALMSKDSFEEFEELIATEIGSLYGLSPKQVRAIVKEVIMRGANSSPASGVDPTGPRKARPATPARRATSSNAAKPAKRGKGGK